MWMLARRANWAVWLLLLGGLLGSRYVPPAAADDRPEQMLFDFDTQSLGQQWTAIGKIQASLQASADNPAARSMRIQAEGAGGVYTLPEQIPGDWSEVQAISFRVYRSPEQVAQHPQSTLEVQVLEADGRARFWRRLTLDHAGWKTVQIPLNRFRWGDGRVPDWTKAARLGFWFRDSADCLLDEIALLPAAEPVGRLWAGELREIAFAGIPADQVREARRGHLVVLTDVAELNLDQLADHLQQVADRLAAEFPFLPTPRQDLFLLVFATRDEYQAFTPRFAQFLNAEARAPTSDGYTMQGISSSYWKPELGSLRPVYTHEFVHAYVGQTASLVNKGEWLHEGLASWVQLTFHPQENFHQIVLAGIADPERRQPLEQLCHGDPIGVPNYWQALTVVEMLIATKPYSDKLAELFAAFQRSGSTTLGPALEPIFQRDWQRFEADWMAFCRQKYGN